MSDDLTSHSQPQLPAEPGASFDHVPDALLASLLEGLKKAPARLKTSVLQSRSDAATAAARFTRDQSRAEVRRMWNHIGGAGRVVMYDAHLAAHPPYVMAEDEAPHIASGGRSGPEGIVFRWNNTLSDPVYFAFHSALMIGRRMGEVPHNVAELQGLFAQEAMYDVLAQESKERHQASTLHRLEEHIAISHARRAARQTLEAPNPKPIDRELSQAFLHGRGFVAPIALVMYEFFKRASRQERGRMMEALYDQGPKATLVGVLSAFGLADPGACYTAGIYAMNVLRNEAHNYELLVGQVPAQRPAAYSPA